MFHCNRITVFIWLTQVITIMRIKNVIMWIAWYRWKTHFLNEKRNWTCCLTFWIWYYIIKKISIHTWRNLIRYAILIFLWNVNLSFLHPNLNFLADLLLLIMFFFLRFCTKHPHLLKQYLDQTLGNPWKNKNNLPASASSRNGWPRLYESDNHSMHIFSIAIPC